MVCIIPCICDKIGRIAILLNSVHGYHGTVSWRIIVKLSTIDFNFGSYAPI
jgi:hypothetical protein